VTPLFLEGRRSTSALTASLVLLVAACASTVSPLTATRSAEPSVSPRASPPPVVASAEQSPTTSPTPPPATSPTVAEITRLEALVAADASDADSQRDLGFALAQRVRETADPSLYAPALAAFDRALATRPDDAVALVGVAGIQLGKHQFADGLITARRAIALSPRRTMPPASCSA
jgi:hypothetical protein